LYDDIPGARKLFSESGLFLSDEKNAEEMQMSERRMRTDERKSAKKTRRKLIASR